MKLLTALLVISSTAITGALFAQNSEPAKPSALEPDQVPPLDKTQYVGAEKCATCHQTYFDGWKTTTHSKMVQRPVTEGPHKNVLADFSIESPHHPELKDVRWVVGNRWKQRFLVEVNGQEVVFPGQWSVQEKKWQPYTAKTDWWWPQHQDWKQRSNVQLCAGCHSTGLDLKTQSWTELNISCESCHGPGRLHSETSKIADIVNPSRLTRQKSMDICFACHAAGKPHGGQTDYAWPVGFKPGDDLAKFWQPFEPTGKQTPEFWPNGTAHKNRVQANTFVQSVMHDAALQCTNCHDVHNGQHTAMTIKSAATNALCNTCHGPGEKQHLKEKLLTDHTHHGPLSKGSTCIECHMAKTGENSVAAESRNHTFEVVSPAETLKNGTANGCNICHTDKTTEWALTQFAQWYPEAK